MFDKIKALFSGNKFVVLGIKYIPLICTLLLMVHISLLLLGICEPVTVSISAVLLVVLLILLSLRFKFCWLHRSMIIYMAVVTLCICAQKYEVFGQLISAIRILVLCLGAGLAGIAVYKKIKNEDCDGCDD